MNRVWASLAGVLLALGVCAADLAADSALLAAPRVQVPPRPPLLGKSPVDTFRELLAMDPALRVSALTNRGAEVRERLLAKLLEYTALSANERELRLRATELRWYLMPLLSAPATNRAALLARVPASLRPLVDLRLVRWSITPPALRQQLLEDDRQMRLYLQLEASTPAQQQALFAGLPPDQRRQLESGFVYWQKLPPGERQRTIDRVSRFFDLTSLERARVLASFSEPERRQMERTLQAFEQLPPEKRARCLRAFGKFASLTPEERAEFLQNAERWQAMSPAEREQFRNLVRQAPILPPLPPGRRTARATNVN